MEYIDYSYNPKDVNEVRKAKYFRRCLFIVFMIIPISIVMFNGKPSEPSEPDSYGIPAKVFGYSMVFFLGCMLYVFDFLIYRIEKFTVGHCHQTIRVTGERICLLDTNDGIKVIIDIQNAFFTYSYYAVGQAIFSIRSRHTDERNNVIRFSTSLENFEDILKGIDPDFRWIPDTYG